MCINCSLGLGVKDFELCEVLGSSWLRSIDYHLIISLPKLFYDPIPNNRIKMKKPKRERERGQKLGTSSVSNFSSIVWHSCHFEITRIF